MGRQLAKALNEYFTRGVGTGAMAMSLVTMISLENVIPFFFNDTATTEIYKAVEDDMRRIWDETLANASNEKTAKDAADLLIGHCEAIRKNRGMEDLEA